MSGGRRTVGRVLLVGAGPGAPDLLTLRAASALKQADVVLYDELVDATVLGFAAPGAELHNVGKRGHDEPTRSQEDINRWLVELAQQGKTVVRLKGGDAFVFGRGGEEASHCARAGVPCEIVPGVSSALAVPAYAGIPVTDRRHAASFAVVTGHKDPTRVSENTRWEALATAVDTLVILMGMRNLPALVARLLAAGRPAETPAAAIMWGSTPQQRTVTAPLSELPKRAQEAGLGAPSVVVIGEVVSLREELAWFERMPLFGRRVLVTRPKGQQGELAAAIRALGGEAVCIPTLEIAPPEDAGPLRSALSGLSAYDVLVFASANAVEATTQVAREQGVAIARPGVRVACVGARTAEAARARGWPVHVVPMREEGQGLGEELVGGASLAGRRVLIPRSEIGRAELAAMLREAGARVNDPVAYRALLPEQRRAELERELLAGELAALTFTSPSTVRNFVAMLGPEARAAAARIPSAAIGPTTARAVTEVGLALRVVAERPSARDLVAGLAGAMSSGATPAEPEDGREEAR